MRYVVCKYKKENGELFITTRQAREFMIRTITKMRQTVDSIVLKETDTYEQALKYKQDYESSDDLINKVTTGK